MSATSPMPEKRRSTRRRSATSAARPPAAVVVLPPPAATPAAEGRPVVEQTVRSAMDALAAVDLLLGMNFSLRVADEAGSRRR